MDPWASRNGLALLRKLLGNRNNEVLKFGCEINPDWLVARLAWVCIRLDVHREFTAGLREDLRGGTTRRLDRKAVAAPPSLNTLRRNASGSGGRGRPPCVSSTSGITVSGCSGANVLARPLRFTESER